ncbi:MAG: hypothetical protein SF123_21125 [Chloroflexota bacterium]|nr:hypothetical protein [Chloroflexota bacterium]
MFGYDFNLFYEAGRAILNGATPYTIPDFNPPLTLALAFALIAWLPYPIAYGLYLIANLALLWSVVKRRILWSLLCFPVLFSLFVGQVDLLIVLLIIKFGPRALPLLLFKPQLAFVIVPWYVLRLKRADWVWCIASGLFLIGLSFLVRPLWIQEWLAIVPTVSSYSIRNSNLYWLVPQSLMTPLLIVGMIIGFFVALRLQNRVDSWATAHLLAPLTNIYSASLLVEKIGWREAALSWAAVLVVGGNIHGGMPMFVVALSILLRAYLESRHARLQSSKSALSKEPVKT